MPSFSSEAREQALIDAFVALADTLVVGYDVVELLHLLVEGCTHLLAVDTAVILLSDRRGQLQVMAYATEEVLLLEQLQLQIDQGPCLECFRTGSMISVPDLTETGDRWPHFTSRTVQEGFRAVHALPMRLRNETIGGLSLFTARPGPLSPEDLQVARGLADIATIGILHERAIHCSEMLAEQLQKALNSRIVIEQAKGVLAEHSGLDFPKVFVLLRAQARKERSRLGDIARRVVEGSLTIDIPPRDRRTN